VYDYSLVPVEYPPEFERVSYVPVEHDPFSEDGVSQQTQAQQEQTQQAPTQPAQPVNQSQQPAAEVARLYVGRSVNNTLSSELTPSTSSTPPAPAVSGQIAAKIAELATDFYNQSVLKPARDIREMGHDLVTDPAYFLHAIGPSLVGLGMSAPTARVGSIWGAERAKIIHNVLRPIEHKLRTTAVLETDAGRIVAGGTRDLTPLQRAALDRGEIAAKARGVHAEVTALNKAASMGATPSELAVTRDHMS
jgi:hypothetical protein